MHRVADCRRGAFAALIWSCGRAAGTLVIVSLVAGCTAGPYQARQDSVGKRFDEKPRTMALVMVDSPAPVLVIRKSTFLSKVASGALSGAMAGLLATSWSIYSSSVNVDNGGEGVLVLAAVIVPTFTLIGMVHGAVTAEPRDTVTAIDEIMGFHRFVDATKDRGFDRRLAARVIAQSNAHKGLVLTPGRSGDGDKDTHADAPARRGAEADGAITLSVQTLGLLKDKSLDDDLSFYVEGRTRLDLPSRGEVEWAVWRYRGDPRPREEWTADDGALIGREIDRATQKLAERIVGRVARDIAGPGRRAHPNDFDIHQDARASFQPG